MDGVRERILDAAGREFADRGYKSATIRRICEAAEANVAAVNYYFGDKQQLYLEAVKQAHHRLSEQFPVPPQVDELSAEVKLRGFVLAMLARMIGGKATPWEQQLMLREVLQPTSACRELVEQYFRPLQEMLLGIVDQLVHAETDRATRQRIAFSIIGQCLFYRIAGDVVEMMGSDEGRDEFSIEVLANHIAEFSLAAISSTSQGSGGGKNATRPTVSDLQQ